MRTLLLLAAIYGLSASLAAAPTPPVPASQAFCETMWVFATPCAVVSTKLVQQVKAFSPMSGCPQCGYMLVSASPLFIEANHTTDAALLGEIITFTLFPTTLMDGCRVGANSASLDITSNLDDQINYCNLHNLVTASNLNQSPGFMELTNEWVCLGVGNSTCSAKFKY